MEFSKLNGYDVKDKTARESISIVKSDLTKANTNIKNLSNDIENEKAVVEVLATRVNDNMSELSEVKNDVVVERGRINTLEIESTSLSNEIKVERSRINNLSTLSSGSTTGDAELRDIRIKADGTTSSSAGNSVREQVTELHNMIDDIYDFDYGWEAGTISTTGVEEPGTSNHYRSKIIPAKLINGKTVNGYGKRYIGFAFYNNGVFVSRNNFYHGSRYIDTSNQYDVRIIIATIEPGTGGSLKDTLSGIQLPEIGVNNVKDIQQGKFEEHNQTIYSTGLISAYGQINDEATTKGNCKSEKIKVDSYDIIEVDVNSHYYGGYCKYLNDVFVSRSPWYTEPFTIENEGYDIILQFASQTEGKTMNDVLSKCNAKVIKNSGNYRLSAIENKMNNIDESWIKKLIECDIPTNNIHFSLDDVCYPFYQLAQLNPQSIFDIPFFNELKTLHDTYGICITMNCFNYLTTIPDYALSNTPNTWQSEFQSNKNWLKFAFHCKDEINVYGAHLNYTINENASDDYNEFVNAVYNITGDYECIDRVIRTQSYRGTLSNVKGMINCNYGPIAFLGAEDSRNSYYLNEVQSARLFNRGKYIDDKNNILFIKSFLRCENNANVDETIAAIEKNPSLGKFVEVYCHASLTDSSIPTLSNVNRMLDWFKERDYKSNYLMNIFQ